MRVRALPRVTLRPRTPTKSGTRSSEVSSTASRVSSGRSSNFRQSPFATKSSPKSTSFPHNNQRRFSSFSDANNKLKIGVVPGDDIGAELTGAATRVISALLHDEVEFVQVEGGMKTFKQKGDALPPSSLQALSKTNGILFGCVNSPKHTEKGYISPILTLREKFDLYANIRFLTSMPVDMAGVRQPRQAVDIAMVRENTEDFFIRKERIESDKNGKYAIAERKISEYASKRIAKAAFELAAKRHAEAKEKAKIEAAINGWPSAPRVASPRVTIIHKANVLNVSDSLFLNSALEVAKQYEGIVEVEDWIVDHFGYALVRDPSRFDVVVAPNMYGDILQDIGAALVGGLSLIPTSNVGDSKNNVILTHPSNIIASREGASSSSSPIGAIRAAGILLSHLGRKSAAHAIERAVQHVLAAKQTLTRDLGGMASIDDVTKAIVAEAQYVQHFELLKAGDV